MLLIISCLFLFLFLSHPSLIFEGASEGLLLWFYTVLPTLFPFMVITSILVSSKALFSLANHSLVAIICGFTCGYPMGGKIIFDLWNKQYISSQQAGYLLSFCNNASPMFISSYFVIQCLEMPSLMIPSIIILFLSPILCSFVFRRYHFSKDGIKGTGTISHLKCSSSGIELFDFAITGSMENIVKIGGYIIFFSILFKLGKYYIGSIDFFKYFLIPSLEITNGLKLLSQYPLFFWQKYILMMSHLSFGGICALFQTKCVLKDTPISLSVYTIEKLITALVTSLLSYFYIRILF